MRRWPKNFSNSENLSFLQGFLFGVLVCIIVAYYDNVCKFFVSHSFVEKSAPNLELINKVQWLYLLVLDFFICWSWKSNECRVSSSRYVNILLTPVWCEVGYCVYVTKVQSVILINCWKLSICWHAQNV